MDRPAGRDRTGRPIQLRRTNLDTAEADTVLVPCGHTLAHVCPACAERARTLRAVQCREGWHLEDEPDLTPDPATDDQQYWVVLRSEAQQSRDQADAAGQDTADFDELIGELDEQIARSGVRGSGEAWGDQLKNTRVSPTRRSTNWVSRGYWIAPVPEPRYVRKSFPTRSASPLLGSS